MLYSMTGYGKTQYVHNDIHYTFEIKSLNSKQIDINLKNASILKDIEFDIRKKLQQQLIRGKVDVLINEVVAENESSINLNLLEKMYNEIIAFGVEKQINVGDIFPILLKMSDNNKKEQILLSEEEKINALNIFDDAIIALIKFRQQEGVVLEQDIVERINTIQNLQNHLPVLEKNRLEKIREKIVSELNQLNGIAIDSNRLEQELIYYIEKLDITEENTRLSAHCTYFLEIVANDLIEKGKKLGFIAQEIGREINTIGSKANDAEIQKIVVQMKDELEKIKEQLNNIL